MVKKYSTRRLATLIGLGLVVTLLSGCVTRPQPLYHWGNFEAQQYGYLQGVMGPEEAIQSLEKIREQAKALGKNVPPGMNAHLGMLYGLTGRTDLFEQLLEAERMAFPESASYVDFLLKQNPKK